ncbi:MAG: DUF3572 domain-containing protein [Paracoccaceae bacterium]|nr:DUF3572 domain-containing protein [Paracoccaceae bacterium]
MRCWIAAENRRIMGIDEAETLAIEALGWLAGEEDLLQVFLGSAGLSSFELRARADDPELLAAVLDFVLMDDGWVQAFAAATDRAPEAALRARAALPGGDLPHWT